MSKNKCIPRMEELAWLDGRSYVQKADPVLCLILDNLNPNKEYKIYRAIYPYGSTVFKEAVLHVPNSNNVIVPINHHSISDALREQLNYRVIPITLSVNKALEMYADFSDKMIPLMLIPPGRLTGIWETLDPPNSYFVKLSWNLSAGARTTFTLPKIMDKTGYKRLERDFGIKHLYIAQEPRDHWFLFKQLANNDNFPADTVWQSEVLFFGKEWFNLIQNKNNCLELRNYLYSIAWEQSMFWRFLITFDLIWQQFAGLLTTDAIKCGAYPLETLKHLIMLGVGALPALSAYDPNELLAPINGLQKTLLDSYGLNIHPTIMLPQHIAFESKTNSCYYSFNVPTLIESVPKSSKVYSVMQLTRDVKRLFDEFYDAAISGKLKIENTPIFEMLKNVDFTFFHSGIDTQEALPNYIADIPKTDEYLLKRPSGYFLRDFCYKSKFFSGCVRIR